MIILYTNGLIEEFVPRELVYTEAELVSSFSEFEKIRSKRLLDLPNTWCIWGIPEGIPIQDDHNRLGSYTMEEEIYSHLIFIHDSEIDPSWNICDDIIYKNYADFSVDLKAFVETLAGEILDETEEMRKQTGEKSMIFLNTIGPTKDKRILFDFDPDLQPEEFYQGGEAVTNFSDNIFDYLKNNYLVEKPFTIYADNKIVISVKDENVNRILNDIQKIKETKEKYEECAFIKKIKDEWTEFISQDKDTKIIKKPRKKKTSKSKDDLKSEENGIQKD